MALRNHNVSRSGRRVCGTPLSGVAASLIPSTGEDGPPYLYPLIATLSIGPSVQMCGRVGTIPVGVTSLAANEPSDFEADGTDGAHLVPFTLLLDGIKYGATDAYGFNLTFGDGITGTGASTQAANVSAASGSLGIVGTVARTQAQNTSTASGWVLSPITGTGASTQAPNTSRATDAVGVAQHFGFSRDPNNGFIVVHGKSALTRDGRIVMVI